MQAQREGLKVSRHPGVFNQIGQTCLIRSLE